MQEKTGRSAMRSPGRPEINQRLIKLAFWEQIAAGLQSEDAARACGISQPLGPRWFRKAGGIAPTNLGATSGRYLSFAEREEISLLHAQQLGVREMPGGLNVRPRPSRASCVVTQRRGMGSCSTAPRWRSGKPSARRNDPRWESLHATTS